MLRKHSILGIVLVIGQLLIGCAAQDDKAQSNPPAPVDQTEQQSAPTQVGEVVDLDVDQFAEILSAEMQLLDVRTPEEVQAGTLVEATHIDIFRDDFLSAVEQQLNKDQPVAVYCKMGGRSARAAKMLQEAGYSKIYNMKGGITAWKAGGWPIDVPGDTN